MPFFKSGILKTMNKMTAKHFFFLLMLSSVTFISSAQSWQWAYSSGMPTRTNAIAFKKDLNGDFYLASYTDSNNLRVATYLQKRDDAQQLLWQKQITGEVSFSDIEVNASNHVIAVGFFIGNIDVDGTTLTSISSTENSAFIFECDEAGVIQWVHSFNPINGDYRSGDLFISSDGSMYLTSQVSGSFGGCAFHKLNSQGDIVKSEFNNDFLIRTFSHILADSVGNVFLSGTCSSTAMFDTIQANLSLSYENFLVKYDSSFTAQWLRTSEYITFDHNNSLVASGNKLYWGVDEFTGNPDTIQIYVYDYSGSLIRKVAGPMPDSFFPSFTFTVNSAGELFMAVNIYTRVYCYHYDSSFNIDWSDTLYTSTSGFPFEHGLTVDDSSFYLAALYFSDTLQIGNTMLINPNSVGHASDIFVAKWSGQLSNSVTELNDNSNLVSVYPNPASEELNVQLYGSPEADISIYSTLSRLVYHSKLKGTELKIPLENLLSGIYFMEINCEGLHPIVKKLVVQ